MTESSSATGLSYLDIAPAPPCSDFMAPRFVGCEPNQSLTLAFPVRAEYANPGGTMQGGFVCAAFDNVFGPLSMLVTQCAPVATIDLITSFQRPIFPGDELIVTAMVKQKGRTLIHMTAEAVNRDGKLIATSATSYLIRPNSEDLPWSMKVK
ncbi:MAG: PaaI family thioesterase [Solirubrobacterales bacterium]